MTSAVARHSSATCSSDVPAEMMATVPASGHWHEHTGLITLGDSKHSVLWCITMQASIRIPETCPRPPLKACHSLPERVLTFWVTAVE